MFEKEECFFCETIFLSKCSCEVIQRIFGRPARWFLPNAQETFALSLQIVEKKEFWKNFNFFQNDPEGA